MKSLMIAAACTVLGAGAARAADYVSIVQETAVNAPAEAVWKKVGGYCDIGAWLKTTCVVTSGSGLEVGTVRRIADRIDEVITARTATSYSYADPNLPIFYHATVEILPTGPKTSKIVYSLFYDQEKLKPEERAANKERRAKMFAGVLQTMKARAEAP